MEKFSLQKRGLQAEKREKSHFCDSQKKRSSMVKGSLKAYPPTKTVNYSRVVLTPMPCLSLCHELLLIVIDFNYYRHHHKYKIVISLISLSGWCVSLP